MLDNGRKTVFIIDPTTPLTEEQWRKAYVMFSGEPENLSFTPEILVLPISITYKNPDGSTGATRETEIEDIRAFVQQHGIENLGTSQPSPAEVLDTFKLADRLGYESAYGLFLPKKLSSTSSLANSLAREFKGKNLQNIYVPLSNFGTGEITLTLEDLMAEPEMGLEEIKKRGEKSLAASKLFLLPNSLEHLWKSGRINPAIYAVGSVMKAKPVITIIKKGEEDGSFGRAGAIRGNISERTLGQLMDFALSYTEGKGEVDALVINKFMDREAEQLYGMAKGRFGNAKLVNDVSNIIYKVVGEAVGLVVRPKNYMAF